MNWWLMLAIYLGQAAYVVIAVGYIGKVIALTPLMATIIKVAIVVILTIVNLIGLKEVSVLSTIFSVIIIIMFGLVTIVGFANWNYNPVEPFIPEGSDIVNQSWHRTCHRHMALLRLYTDFKFRRRNIKS